MNQSNIFGKEDFIPPKVNTQTFLEEMLATHPELLEPHYHSLLMIEYGRFAKQDLRSIKVITWLLDKSPDIERACRKFRANAL